MTESQLPIQQPPQNKQNPVVTLLRRYWLPIVLIILVIIFVAQNNERVKIEVFFVDVRARLWLVFAITALVGFLAGLLLARRRAHRRGAEADN